MKQLPDPERARAIAGWLRDADRYTDSRLDFDGAFNRPPEMVEAAEMLLALLGKDEDSSSDFPPFPHYVMQANVDPAVYRDSILVFKVTYEHVVTYNDFDAAKRKTDELNAQAKAKRAIARQAK